MKLFLDNCKLGDTLVCNLLLEIQLPAVDLIEQQVHGLMELQGLTHLLMKVIEEEDCVVGR